MEGEKELDKVLLGFGMAFEVRNGILPFKLRKPLVLYAKRNLAECNPALQRRHQVNAREQGLNPQGYKRSPLLTYTIQPDGSVADVRLVNGSGSASVDSYALGWVRASKYDSRPGCPPIHTTVAISIHLR